MYINFVFTFLIIFLKYIEIKDKDMKKLLFVLSLILFLWAPAFAQSDHNHGLFSSRNQQNDNSPSRDHPGGTTSGGGGNESPIGSGLLVITGLSLGYACIKPNRKKDD